MTNDFTFVIPNTAWFGKRYWHNFPYTEALLKGALTQRGYGVSVIDANIDNLSENELEQRVRESNPKVVGIGEMALEYKDCFHRSFEIVKGVDRGIKTVAGGIYVTLSPEIAAKDTNIDYFIFGEGEQRLPELLRAIHAGETPKHLDGVAFRADGRLYINPLNKENVINLEELPLPDYDGFNMQRYMNYQQKFTQNFRFKQLPVAITMTSRGCPFRCTFCSSKEIYSQHLRSMSHERVLKEVDMLTEQYGAKELVFVDDSLLFPKNRAIQIMNGLIERKKQGKNISWKSNNLAIHHMQDGEVLDKMKESGCYQVIVSIESGSAQTLKRMKKPVNLEMAIKTLEKIKARNFDNVSSNFVIGMPGDTWEDIRENFSWVEGVIDRGLLDYAVFHIATPFPKTELYETCKKSKYLPEDFNFEDPEYYGFGRGVITTPEFTPSELQVLRAYEWDRINFKTLAKQEKIAGMLGINMQELEDWRVETRRSVGLHVRSADKRSS